MKVILKNGIVIEDVPEETVLKLAQVKSRAKVPSYAPVRLRKKSLDCTICSGPLTRGQSKYCSKECGKEGKQIWDRKYKRRLRKPGRKRKKRKKCIMCGARLPKNKGKYCSKSCAHEARKAKMRVYARKRFKASQLKKVKGPKSLLPKFF